MKSLYLLFAISLFTHEIQNTNTNNPFIGTWEYQENNTIFRVQLYMEEASIRGHYEKVSIINNIEVPIFKSNREIGFGETFGPVIYGNNDGNLLIAGIDDNTVTTQYEILGSLSGTLKMEIISNNPITVTWKVKLNNESRLDYDNRVFSIPADVILTRVD